MKGAARKALWLRTRSPSPNSRYQLDQLQRQVRLGATGATSGAIGATAGAESSLDSPFPKGQSGEAFGWSVKVADFDPDANEVVEAC